MTDWYVYHSAETMDCRYGNPEKNHVFSTSDKKKLCLNDDIWIIEGFGESPKIFYLAAHFIYKETEYPPFPSPYKGGKYSDFNVMYAGPGNSYGSKFNLTFTDHPWFKELHSKYITKQKFFNDISGLPDVTSGLHGLTKP
jgi:hypothetical protein